MHPIAQNALAKLIELEAVRRSRGLDQPATLPFTAAKTKAYVEERSWPELERVHAELQLLSQQQSIAIEWDRKAGQRGRIVRVTLQDADAVAEALGVTPYWQTLAQAEQRLRPRVPEFPNIELLLRRWQQLKSPRGRGPEAWAAFEEAASVLAHLSTTPQLGTAARRVSTVLLGDSKRLERLAVELDLLTAEDLDDAARPIEFLFEALGLVRFPQPVLIAGPAVTVAGSARMNPASPYWGVAPDAIARLEDVGTFLMTVENLVPFNELARGQAGPLKGTILFSNGMPSPSFCHFYSNILRGLPAGCRLLHWGDTDLGGFRIAKLLARSAAELGRSLELWQMGASQPGRRPLSSRELDEIQRIAVSYGWDLLVESLKEASEQEAQALRLPS